MVGGDTHRELRDSFGTASAGGRAEPEVERGALLRASKPVKNLELEGGTSRLGFCAQKKR